MAKQWRPDLSSHEELVMEMTKVANSDADCKISETDMTKMCIEKCYELMLKKKVVYRKRKRLVRFGF
jgi:hypothetical protein